MKTLRRVVALFVAVLALTACTPEQVAQFLAVTEPTRHVLSDEQLVALRQCESGGNYQAAGRYRGAYQFLQSTWDDVASRHYPWLVGRDPATVEFWWQDAMTRALFAEAGARPWPVCGRRL